MRYAVFCFKQHYPRGGLMDLIARDVDDLERARVIANHPRWENDSGIDYYQIVDMDTWRVVEIGGILASDELMNSTGREDYFIGSKP